MSNIDRSGLSYDIVSGLRAAASRQDGRSAKGKYSSASPLGNMMRDAADEIIRLRAELAKARDEGIEAAAIWHDAEAQRLPPRWHRKISAHQTSAAAIRATKEGVGNGQAR